MHTYILTLITQITQCTKIPAQDETALSSSLVSVSLRMLTEQSVVFI